MFLAAAALLAALPAATAGVHADHTTAEVSIPAGSSVPGCESTNECNVPADVTIAVGGVVTWFNDDMAAHTVTSGTTGAPPSGGPDGTFDAGLLLPGDTFTFKFKADGTYPYFCIVHPWRTGVVTVDDHPIPAWVVSTFRYYLDGAISDDEVIGSLDFLVREGILQVAAPAEHVVWPMSAIKFILSYYIDVSTTYYGQAKLIHALEHVIAHQTDMVAVLYREAGNHTGHVKIFYPNGTFAFNFGSTYGNDGGRSFYDPYRVDVGADGSVSVTARRGGVAPSATHVLLDTYYPNSAFKFSLGPSGYGWPGWVGAADVAVGPDGRVFVLADVVQVFHPNGTFAFDFVHQVSGVDNARIAVGPDGRIVVSGPNEARVFHPNGTFAFDLEPHVSAFVDYSINGPDVAVGPDGRIVAAHGGVWVYHPNGTLAFDLNVGSADVAVGPDGRIFVTTRGGPNFYGVVRVYHPNGTFAFDMAPGGAFDMAPGGAADIAIGPVLSPAVFGYDIPPLPFLPPAPPASDTAPPPAPVTVVIEPGAPAGPLNFTAAGHAANLTIDVAGLAGAGGPPLDGSASSVVTFPPTETSVAASFATVTFPPDVTAAHVPAGGRLALRVTADIPDDARAQGALAYEGSGRVTLQRVVEVGGASGRVTFDMPVRILLEGQAGGRAFYIEGAGGTITPIDQACAVDDVGRVHRHLGGAGECQMDSADGDKIIYTYHLTRFGTALPERAAPPPVVHTCSVAIGMPDLGMSARAGERSAPVRQEVINSGSAPFDSVELAAAPWLAEQGAGPLPSGKAPTPPAPVFGTAEGRASAVLTASLVWSLPASVTEISSAALGGPYAALADGTAVARGLGGGDSSPLWFRLNLSSYADAQGGTLVQEVTYQATCRVP